MAASPRNPIRPGSEHAGVGAREPPVHFLGLRRWESCLATESVRREDGGQGPVAQRASVPLRNSHSAWRLPVLLQRSRRPGIHDLHEDSERRTYVAKKRICKSTTLGGGRKTDPAR